MKKMIFAKKALLAILLAGSASSAMAVEQSVLTVKGNIIKMSCTLGAADLTKTVTLTDIGIDALKAGSYAPVNFTFTFTDCDTSYTTVTANATGDAAASNVPGYTGVDKVLASTGTATGVGVGLLGLTSTTGTATGALPLGEDSAPAPLTAQANSLTGGVLTMGAQIIPLDTGVDAEPGTVVSAATITFTYA